MSKIKYLLAGQQVEVIEKTSSGYLVRNLYDNQGDDSYDPDQYSEDELTGEVYYIDMVFDKPPMQRFYNEIEVLQKRISNLNAERRSAEEQMIKAKQKFEEIKIDFYKKMEKFKKYEQLQLLEDFLDGKITHFVITGKWIDPKIEEFDKYMKTNDDYSKDLKLITLFGKSEGGLQWCVNEYCDGSGSWRSVDPCTSYEQALDKMRKYLDSQFKESPSNRVLDAAHKYEIPIPQEYFESYKDRIKKNLQNDINNKQLELSKISNRLLEIDKMKNNGDTH